MENELSLTETKQRRERWSQRLHQMRGSGARRACKGNPSASLLPLLQRLPDDAIVIDAGCGESGDYRIARHNGLRSFRLDLFPPSTSEHFIQADALKLPFGRQTVDGVINHAMLSLIAPFDRWQFYEEVARVLKPGGLLSTTPYDLADGFQIKTAIENNRAFDLGLHKVGSGLYQKCSDPNCKEHPPLDSWVALERSVNQIDVDKDFRRLAPILVAWFTRPRWSVKETIKFTGRQEWEVNAVVQGCIDCGIFDPDEGSMDVPWFDYFLKDETADGNIALVLDVLAIEGRIRRWRNEQGELLFQAIPDET